MRSRSPFETKKNTGRRVRTLRLAPALSPHHAATVCRTGNQGREEFCQTDILIGSSEFRIPVLAAAARAVDAAQGYVPQQCIYLVDYVGKNEKKSTQGIYAVSGTPLKARVDGGISRTGI